MYVSPYILPRNPGMYEVVGCNSDITFLVKSRECGFALLE